ncbi:MAG: M3 family metallopeptidase, partial [Betaproteobacteria bacterium]
TDASIAWVMHISSVLYGIEFRQSPVTTWHHEVQHYDVYDSRSGQFLAGLYLDLFPRDGKFSHAANFGVRSTSTLAQRTPYAVLVANLDRKGLESSELETLVHEFGHALHHMFARTRYVAHGGSGLEWDFVEAPSQMYEEWSRRKESLQLISKFCTGCKTVDDDLVNRIESARKLGIGMRYLDQHLLADYDVTLYGDKVVDPLQTWIRLDSETVLGHTPGTLFPSSFEHIIRGYAAGYYGYMWSEVLALDMLSAYGENIMNPRAGRRFRDIVLAHGGERPAARMVEEFLGRKPSNAAFFAEITGSRKAH